MDQIYFHGFGHTQTPNHPNGFFLFGFLRLCEIVSTRHIQMPGSPPEAPFPPWTLKWRTSAFHHCVSALQATFWKLDRSASHLGSTLTLINTHLQTQGIVFTPELLDAMSDTTIYLDSLLFYFRITADIVAKLVPFLYPKSPQIPTRSFRDHIAWYRRSPTFDSEYSSILATSIDWFELLAGKHPKGFRDVLTHYLGNYQFGWRNAGPPESFEFKASMMSELGYASTDLIPDIKAIGRGLFLYLDKTFTHFSRLIRSQFNGQFLLPDRVIAEFFEFEDAAMPSLWLYPTVDDVSVPTT